MEHQSFGYWLKRKRKALDLTRDQLAKRVGYSAAALRKIEEEERRPSVEAAGRLAEVFNIPSSERESFLSFARGDSSTAPTEMLEDVPWRAAANVHRSNIPATTTSLIARQHEIAQVREYLSRDDVRLVTLMGPPGIGKTRLSIESARASLDDFSDGVFFVALAPLDDPNLIASAIAQAFGFVGAKNMSTFEQLRQGIADKHLLLVLDNCEHLIEEVASLTSDLLSVCSHLKILATSRESLRIPGEWLYTVPAFDIPTEGSSLVGENLATSPALWLFAERARAVRSDFSLNADNIETVAAICARLDGLPLVIELIAARMRLMTPQALLERLSTQFVLTADGMRAASERQKTLHNAIHWSYGLLPPEEQKLFAYLSVFSGGFTLDTVEVMFSPFSINKPVPNLIASLVDKSLLQHDPVEPTGTRYTMLMTIQEFGRTRLHETGEETEIRNRHLAYFLDLAEKADQELRGQDQLEWLYRLASNRDNLRAALEWAMETGQTKVALELARKLHWFWFVRGDHTEGQQWLARVVEMRDISTYPREQAEVLAQLANHILLRTGNNRAQPFAEQALLIARAHQDEHTTAKALLILGLISMYEKDHTKAQDILRESQQLFRHVHDEWGYANATMALGTTFWDDEDWTTALLWGQQAFAGFQTLGDRYFQSVTLRHIGFLSVNLGDVAHGMAALRESLLLAQQLHSKYEIFQTLWRFAQAALRLDKTVRAVRLYWAARNISNTIGALWQQDDIEFDANLAACRAALREAEFTKAVEQGRAMTMEQAIAYALEDPE